MIEDMTLRKLSEKTQIAYIRAVVKLTRHMGRSPDTATAVHRGDKVRALRTAATQRICRVLWCLISTTFSMSEANDET